MQLYETVTSYRRWYDNKRNFETVKHTHIVDAISVSDAETRITEELFSNYNIDGYFRVNSCVESNINYIVLNESSDQYFFKVKLQFLQPHSKVLKVKYSYNLLVRADIETEVSASLRNIFRNSVFPFKLHTIKQCEIDNVFLKEIQPIDDYNVYQIESIFLK